jgi:probable LLM family oxidoreductase
LELGIYSFGEIEEIGLDGKPAQNRLHELLAEIKLADDLGLDVFALGEHHRPDFVVSAPAVVLAAAATITKKIKLSSAVTVLSSEDPIRVYQQYATLDLISNGRAEVMAGRGSFIESFPLFGYQLDDYNELFTEKLEMLLKINSENPLSWQGTFTQTVKNVGVFPRAVNNNLPIWIAVGGTPQSAMRAGRLGLPMAVAIIGGTPESFIPFVQMYRDTAAKQGFDASNLPLGINSHGYISEDSQTAKKEWYPYISKTMARLGKERGWSPMTTAQYDFMCSPRGAFLAGSPQEVAEKILWEHEIFGNSRFLCYFSVGGVPHQKVMKSIELFATKVAPIVQKALA